MAFITTKIEKYNFKSTTGDLSDQLNSFLGNIPTKFSVKSNEYKELVINNGNISVQIDNGFLNDIRTADIVKFDNGWFIFTEDIQGGTIAVQGRIAIIKFSDTEFFLSATSNHASGSGPSGGNVKWAFSVENPDNYVAFAPLISVSSNFASGVTVDGVYLQSGILSDVWSKDGLVINGHTFYGAQELCICAD